MPTARRTALIFGVTGQDGAYLARFLLDKGYQVAGIYRHEQEDFANLQELGVADQAVADQVRLLPFDYGAFEGIRGILETTAPDEIYNLAAQSSVAASFQTPVETGKVNGLFVAALLESLRDVKPNARFFQAASAEIFGAQSGVLNEATPVQPRNPYGCAKAYAYWMTRTFRESYGLHAANGILFNHESPLRAPHFVTRKITLAVARIKHGQQHELKLGNLDVQRDWGFAGDYVEAMWLMLQQPQADDYIIATGQMRRLREWVDLAFASAGLDSRDFVRVEQSLLRPTDAPAVAADPGKAARQLNWRAQVQFEELIQMMVETDLCRVGSGEI